MWKVKIEPLRAKHGLICICHSHFPISDDVFLVFLMPLMQFIISTIITIDSVDREHAWGRAAKPRETRAEARRKDPLNLPLICIFFYSRRSWLWEKKNDRSRSIVVVVVVIIIIIIIFIIIISSSSSSRLVVVHISHPWDILL